MKSLVILNPRSGRLPRQPRVRALLAKTIASWPTEVELALTEGPGHARELALRAVESGCDRVVVVGGDGTMNEAAQSLVHTPTALALVPSGSGNGLARHLRLPLSPITALRLGLDPGAHIATIDSGRANGHAFFTVMGLGFDAEVGRRFNASARRGAAAYVAATAAAFAASRPEIWKVGTNGTAESLQLLWLAVANADQYGNNAVIAPGARCDDGALDMIAVSPVGLLGAVELSARVFLRSFDRSRLVRRWRGTSFTVERPAPELIHTDGELHQTDARVQIDLVPASLRIVTGRNGAAPP